MTLAAGVDEDLHGDQNIDGVDVRSDIVGVEGMHSSSKCPCQSRLCGGVGIGNCRRVWKAPTRIVSTD